MVSRSNPIIKTKPNRTEQKRWRAMYCWCDGRRLFACFGGRGEEGERGEEEEEEEEEKEKEGRDGRRRSKFE